MPPRVSSAAHAAERRKDDDEGKAFFLPPRHQEVTQEVSRTQAGDAAGHQGRGPPPGGPRGN